MEDYILNRHNTHRFEDSSYLVTTEQGSWSLLTENEYRKLESKRLDPGSDLWKHLEDRGIVLTEDNVQDVVKKHALKNQFLFTGPSLHIITTTKRCNHRCSYCHSMPVESDKNSFDLDEETGKDIVDFALGTSSKMVNFEFQGGEPLLNFSNVKKIMDYAEKRAEEEEKNVGFSMVSNLTKVDENVIEDIKNRNLKVTTSLDGPRDLHDSNRNYLGGKGTYRDVVENIRMMRDAGIDINALCTITKDSLEQGKKIVDKYRDLDLEYIWLRPLNKIGFAEKDWDDIGYTAEEFVNFYENTLRYILEGKNDIKELYAMLLSKKILGIKDPEMTEMTSPCGAGISQLLYDQNGDIFTCDEGKIFEEFKLGNVKSSDWKDIITDETFISMIDISSKKNYLCNDCEWEPFCAVCPVNTYSEQDTVVSKLPEDFRCNIHEGLVETVFKKLLFKKEYRKQLEQWSKQSDIFR